MNSKLNVWVLFLSVLAHPSVGFSHTCKFSALLVEAIGYDHSGCAEYPNDIAESIKNTTYLAFRLGDPKKNMRSLKTSDIAKLKSITRIDVVANNLNQIDFTAFAELKKIESVSINLYLDSENNQKLKQTFHKNIFKGLNHVDTLTIGFSYVDKPIQIPDGLFSSLKSANEITIENLALSQNSVDARFRLPKNLKKLVLNANNIKHLESNMFNALSELKELTITANPVENIYENAFFGLTSLESLYLDFGSYPTPDGVGNLKIHRKSFAGLPNLANLTISARAKTTIEPEAFLDLVNVKKFEVLRIGQLSEIKKNTFSGLKNIEALNLSNLYIELIEEGAFFGLDRLRDLNLQGNSLSKTVFTKNLFSDIKNVELIYLTEALLTQINTDAFDDLKKLTHFTCYSCAASFSSQHFRNLSSLITLQLSSISLEKNTKFSISEDFFKYVPNLKKLGVESVALDSYPGIFKDFKTIETVITTNSPYPLVLSKGVLDGFRIYDAHRGSTDAAFVFSNQLVTSDLLSEVNYLNNFKINETWIDIDTPVHSPPRYKHLSISLPNIMHLSSGLLSEIKGIPAITLQAPPAVQVIDSNVFEGINSLNSLKLHLPGVLSLPANLFSDSERLERLEVVANNLNEIGIGTFKNASSIKHLTIISSQLNSLKRGQLDGLAGIESIYIEAPLEYIEAKTFENLHNLKKITFSKAWLSQTTKGAFFGNFKNPVVIEGLPENFASDENNKDSF